MSPRVDDDREAERLAERLHEQRLREESREKGKRVQDTAFADRLKASDQERRENVSGQREAHEKGVQQRTRDSRGKDVLKKAREFAQHDQGRAAQRQRGAAILGQTHDAGRRTDLEYAHARDQGHQSEQERVGLRSKDEGSEALRSERRKNALAHTERQGARVEASTESSAKGGGAPADGGTERASEREAGGQGGKGQQREGGGGAGAGTGQFRINPGLLAPVPVAQPKDSGRSERMRALANEIAQKIVERARVGKNAQGHAEFQIELRSNVLAGLNIKVTARQGRIAAVFSGGNKEVLEQLQGQLEGLRAALTGRNLIVEELRIEGRK
ncbi:MAG: flagellar hook-length control protein FliK [Myxococcaceae bacterium]